MESEPHTNAQPEFPVTVDVVVLAIRELPKDPERKQRPRLALCAALARRDEDPFKGCWALPGDSVIRDSRGRNESLDDAALRKLTDAVGIHVKPGGVYLGQLGAYGEPTRDPRGNVTVAYLAIVPPAVLALGQRRKLARAALAEERGGPGAAGRATAVEWRPVDEALADGDALAFDHAQILADGVRRVADLIDTTALATAFLDATFTVPQLRRVYELVWGLGHNALDSSNFYSRVVKMHGIFEMVRERDATADAESQAWDEQVANTGMLPLDFAPDSDLESAPGLWSASSPGRPPSSYFRRGRRVLEQGFTAPLDRPIRMRR